MTKITLNTEFITLGQLLKLVHAVNQGSEAKVFLQNTPVLVNNEPETRRGRKLYPFDVVKIGEKSYVIA